MKFISSQQHTWTTFTTLQNLSAQKYFQLTAIHSLPFYSSNSKQFITPLHNHAKHQASGLYSVETQHSTLTAVNSHYTTPNQHIWATQTFKLALTAYYDNCIYILAASATHYPHGTGLTWAIRNTSVHKICFLYSHYPSTQCSQNCTLFLNPEVTIQPTGLVQDSSNILALCQ
jgi:hypothetical protein